eukprot:m.291055 g.291055  ORF g.291055 m.291055 type:complete len:53 (+) comp16381_c0_seq4:7641-7799(+)
MYCIHMSLGMQFEKKFSVYFLTRLERALLAGRFSCASVPLVRLFSFISPPFC